MYHLEKDKCQKFRVCQKMFLSAIGLSTDKTIGNVLSKTQIMHLIKEEKLNLKRNKQKTSKTSDLVNHHILS